MILLLCVTFDLLSRSSSPPFQFSIPDVISDVTSFFASSSLQMFSFHMMDISAKKFKDQEKKRKKFQYCWQYINPVLMVFAHLIHTSFVSFDDT